LLHDLSKFKIIKDITLGYEVIYYPTHPNARKGSGIVYLHRIIMENHLGRYLESNEIVHHIDKNRSNNILENLELTTAAEHIKHHHPAYLELRMCKKCNKEFKPKKDNQYYCCIKCGHENNCKIEWPSVEWLEEQLKTKSMVKLGKELGVSDNAIKKHLKKIKL
jgi:predicted Zn-ribbon and HTH transcriptional regulator